MTHNADRATLNALRLRYREGKADLLQEIGEPGVSTRGIHSQLKAMSRLTDQALRGLWAVADLPDAFSLVAVGGYGRGELFP
jgi:[protein-PII] uridylyltransferase